MTRNLYRIFHFLLIPLLVIANGSHPAIASTGKVSEVEIEITHNPIKKVATGKRIELEVEIKDDSGIDVVRVYFKSYEVEYYSFIELNRSEDEHYRGTIPAPAKGCEQIEYLILIKNGNNQVIKTQTYPVIVQHVDNKRQPVAKGDPIKVYTELHPVSESIIGFSDNITIDMIESSAKFGDVLGLYGSSSGTSDAVSGGTVYASSSGISTTTIVTASVVGLAAVVGAGVVAGSSSGGSGGADENSDNEEERNTLLGQWNTRGNDDVDRLTGNITFYDNGTFYDENSRITASGTWTLSGTNLRMRYSRAIYNGTFLQNSTAFTMVGNVGWTLYFSK